MNQGKLFENQFKKSVSKLDGVWLYRFNDGTGSWDSGQKTRFQTSNVCDFGMFCRRTLFLLELKSHNGKSLPHSAIRENQIVGLKDSANYDGIVAGLLVFFSDLSRCFFLDARLVYAHWKSSGRKSIPVSFFEENGIEVPCKKLRVNYLYDIGFLINQVMEGNHERNIQEFVCV